MNAQPAETRNTEPAAPLAVGALREKWNFPSDHLPVSAQVELLGGAYAVASWNVLNSAYMRYIESDEQGLVGSLITEEHATDIAGPTLREQRLVKSIQHLLDSGASICCLQEAGKDFRHLLEESLAESHPQFRVLTTGTEEDKDCGVILYNSDRLVLEGSQTVMPFENGKKYIQAARFRTAGNETLRVVNTHVPGGPENGPTGRAFLNKWLNENRFEGIDLLLGDFNFNTSEIAKSLPASVSQWQNLSPDYNTHVNLAREAAKLDGIFLKDPSGAVVTSSAKNEITEICPSATQVHSLLN